MNKLYAIFLGLILAITTGFGISAFYPEPKMPQYPSSIPTTAPVIPQYCYSENPRSAVCTKYFDDQVAQDAQNQEKNNKYTEDTKNFGTKSAIYTRRVLFYGVVVGAVYALLGMLITKKSRIVANGLLMGGVLTAVFVRFIIGLASFGGFFPNSEIVEDNTTLMEFGILVVLSAVIILVGLTTFKDEK